ncbi:alanine racemase [Sulfuricystis multivorans]|uniref:alanine racemase n=1 Tax=Sulfuricystis multivorans TaxID=2211108 RepID=UPI000F824DCD|nr:alanine racemase [Sulfuricystis multivorans]
MPRPIRAIIDLSALRHNFSVARRHATAARLWAVVKADAYGHGLERTVAALQARADGFALIELERAIALREAGLTKPLLMLEGCYATSDVPLFIRHRLIPVVHRSEQLDWLLASNWPADLPVYLKLNTGMNRLGFDAAGLTNAKSALAKRHVGSVLMSHFADADGPRGIDWQLERFRAMTAGMSEATSLGNSATILRYPESVGDWARPGIMLYGGSPFPQTKSAAELDLRPVMTLQSEIVAVQHLAAGECIGYGCAFTADRPMRVGIVACGYADGYPRHAPTGTPVLVAGMRTRLLGRVSMDKLCVDLTDLPEKIGVAGKVTLWGEGLAADEVAMAAGTISYELFCALSPRVPVSEVGGWPK